ncbi:hypothetical protein [Aliihoeflea sp. PC F10.4]
MFTVSDILKVLDQIPVWKSLKALPGKLDALEKRVSELEAELARRPAPEVCPLCHGEMKLSNVETHWMGDTEFHNYVCSTEGCSHKRQRRVNLDG